MSKKPIQYPLKQSPLYHLRRKKKLEELLGISCKELYNLDISQCYYNFSIPKKDGSSREVSAPNKKLKLVQKRLLRLLQRIESPDWLISGKRGKSYTDNARFHLDSKNVLTIDIRDFYNSCKHKYIYNLFINVFETSPDVAYLFCKLTILFCKLPTGAPTSQLLAFWAYKDTFTQIDQIAEKCGCKFSLYVDDMTFSSQNIIPVSTLLKDVSFALNSVNLRMKYSKIVHYQNDNAKLITGTVIDKNSNLRVPNKLRHSIIKDLNKLKSKKANVEEKNKICLSLIGRIRVAQTIESGIFPEALKYALTFKH